MERTLDFGSGSSRFAWVGVTAAVLVGSWIAAHLPLMDDEANAVILALRGTSAVFRAGLSKGGHFHPPLNDLILSAWLSLVPPRSLFVLRIPALFFWTLTLGVSWVALAPMASPRERSVSIGFAMLVPAHLALAYAATWYSFAACLSVGSTAALLRAVGATDRTARLLWGLLWSALLVALGYTVFAWPALVLGQLVCLRWLCGRSVFREHAPLLTGGLLLAGVALSPTVLTLFDRMSYAVRGQAGGGGVTSLGGLVALLIGQSAPALPWCMGASAGLVLLGLALLTRAPKGPASGLLVIGAVVLAVLAATQTLSDKRLLLATPFLAAGVGSALARLGGKKPFVCLLLGWAPTYAAFFGVVQVPVLFPRYQNPLAEIVALHHQASMPSRLIGEQPALVLCAAMAAGMARELVTGASDARPVTWATSADKLKSELERAMAESRMARSMNLVAFVPHGLRWLEEAEGVLAEAGYRRALQRAFGQDALTRLRHPTLASETARYVLVRFERTEP